MARAARLDRDPHRLQLGQLGYVFESARKSDAFAAVIVGRCALHGAKNGTMIGIIQRTIDERGGLAIAARSLSPDADLSRAGLTPFAAIEIMLALEKEFRIEFPKHMLNRQSLSSINAICACVHEAQAAQELRRAA
jgi:acyl carrier protein